MLHGTWPTGLVQTDLFQDQLKNIHSEVIMKAKLPNGERILTFEEMISSYKKRMSINIELKGFNLLAVEKIVDLLIKYDAFEGVRYSAFYHPFYTKLYDYYKAKNVKKEIFFGFLVDNLEALPYFELYNPGETDQMTL